MTSIGLMNTEILTFYICTSPLQKQLEELRSKMGASLSQRYETQQKGTAKIMADHDRLGKDLMKVRVIKDYGR